MIKITNYNLSALAAIKSLKSRATTSAIANYEGLSHAGAQHHLNRLQKARRITRNKKTKVWSVN